MAATGSARDPRDVSNQLQTFDPFAREPAYVRVNMRLIDRALRRLTGCGEIVMLDIGANSGLQTNLAYTRANVLGLGLRSHLIDIDLAALRLARQEVIAQSATYTLADAANLPFSRAFDLIIFANALHLLDAPAKQSALLDAHRVLKAGGVLAVNTTFYDGAYPEESKPFYSRWIRRTIAEINQRLPNRIKSEKAQAMEWLGAIDYTALIEGNGFRVVERRERRVLLTQAAVRAISSYSEFAKGALHATDEDAEEASRALQATVRRTFNELSMRLLPRNWLEIIAVKD